MPCQWSPEALYHQEIFRDYTAALPWELRCSLAKLGGMGMAGWTFKARIRRAPNWCWYSKVSAAPAPDRPLVFRHVFVQRVRLRAILAAGFGFGLSLALFLVSWYRLVTGWLGLVLASISCHCHHSHSMVAYTIEVLSPPPKYHVILTGIMQIYR